MKKRMVCLFLSLCLVLSGVVCFAQPAEKADIIILFENDVHCQVEGYAKIAALKESLRNEADNIGVVSAGDYVQGGNLGVISQGEYIIHLMNMVGYDAVTLGNHEFDYRLDRLNTLISVLEAPVVCSNFRKLPEKRPVFDPYVMVRYNDIDVAYVGITTPATLTSSAPTQFLDEDGNYLYDFAAEELCEVVQESVNDAIEEGAEYVIALSHLGTENDKEEWLAPYVAQNTTGIDVMLDGHSHSVVPGMRVKDQAGEDVLIASTGTAFSYIGKLTIDEGEITTELLDVELCEEESEEILAYVNEINSEMEEVGGRGIGNTDFALHYADENENRLIRNNQTNLGDFCADAYREITGAQIGVINGGGIRAGLDAGEITFNELLSIFPYNNTTAVAEVTGQQILDLLEMSVRNYPEENGGFQHVSGLTYDLYPEIPSSVVLDAEGAFVEVNGTYRVQNLMVENQQTGEYEPIEPDKIYTLASHSYLLMECGDGNTMFKHAKSVTDTGILDVELLESYVTDHMGGEISSIYKTAQNRVTVKDGLPQEEEAIEEEQPWENPYEDVKETDWYFESVQYVTEENLFTGTEENLFSPEEEITRAMMVTVLWRLEGEPQAMGEDFVDVNDGDYYQTAVAWAAENGIITGYSETEFGPDDFIQREQIAAVMHRYATYKDVAPEGAWAIRLDYADLQEVSEYATEGLMYCTMKGIMQGKENNMFCPKDSATRAEAAAILQRYVETNQYDWAPYGR